MSLSMIKGGSIPREYHPANQQRHVEALDRGIIAGYPMIDVKATVYDGSYHEVDSSEMAFKIAGSMAVQAACKKAKPVLLEPIMKVEVVTPKTFMGDVIGDLNGQRAQIKEMRDRGQNRRSTPTCRWPRCSVTPRLCGPCHRAGPRTPWNSVITTEAPKNVAEAVMRIQRGCYTRI